MGDKKVDNNTIELLSKNIRDSHGLINRFRWRLMQNFIEGKILDIGCAQGAYVDRLCSLGFDAYGIDLLDFSDVWNNSPYKKHFKCVKNGYFDLYEKNEFDTILLFEVLEHIPDVDNYLEDIYRICKKRLILSVPNAIDQYDMRRSGLTHHHYVDTSHVNFFSEEEIKNKLITHHFGIRFVKKINPINPAFLFFRSMGFPMLFAKFISKINKVAPKKYFGSIFLVVEKEEYSKGTET